MDQAAMSRKVDPAEAAMKKAERVTAATVVHAEEMED